MKRSMLILLLSVLCADAGAQDVFISWNTIGPSGLFMSESGDRMLVSLGQPVSGSSQSSGVVLHAGFLAFCGAAGPVSSVAGPNSFPAEYSLDQNYPNPFNPSTTIRFELPKSSEVRLSVYDVLGREVSVLVNERNSAGSYEVKFDAAGLSSGVYVYRIQAGDFVQAKKFVVLK